MRRHRWLGCLVAFLGLAPSVRADVRKPLEVGGTLGYALPVGSLERGSSSSDVTFGFADVQADGVYRFDDRWAAGLALRYGVLLPKLCSSAADCWSSVGHDIGVAAVGRVYPGRWGTFQPAFDVQLGYEWLGSKRVDNGVTSERTYRGLDAALRAQGLFALGSCISIGPLVELNGGVFGHRSLQAPGVEVSGSTDGPRVHFWILAGFRAAIHW